MKRELVSVSDRVYEQASTLIFVKVRDCVYRETGRMTVLQVYDQVWSRVGEQLREIPWLART
jgi:hypothetical protein